ncbi:MAG: S41 family peptidase [Bacteroidota bacterium]|nr:S41 family peptidase [Bacteroidota bacterium]
MKSKFNYKVPILIAVVAIIGIIAGTKLKGTSKTNNGGDPKTKLLEILQLIDREYVDKPDDEKISDAAITAMLKELDPHSVYIPITEVQANNEDLIGNFEGIGVEFNLLNDTIVVVTPISGGPSEQVGIRSGDRIIKIDGKLVAGVKFKNEDVFKNLRGKKGTKVTVSIQRRDDKKLVDITITRDKIPIFSVDASYMAAPSVGYIKINRFSGTTIKEYIKAMTILKGKGMKNLILDLRGNPGGFLNAAFQLADDYLQDNKLVVYTEGRNRTREEYNATSAGNFEKGKLIILIDEGSASASEIVSGSVQDWDRALIIGRRSFGKGLVQEPFRLSDGSEVRLTVARYYTPSKRSIQRSYKGGVDDYYEDMNRRFEHGELYSKDSSSKDQDTVAYYTASKRIVYGGGGIMPDIFVPLDTTGNSKYLNQLFNKGIINDFILNHLDKNRDNLKAKYKNFEEFNNKWVADDQFVKLLTSYATANKLPLDEKGLKNSNTIIKIQLKALIARQLYGGDAYYEVINVLNESYNVALKAMSDNTFDKMKINYK